MDKLKLAKKNTGSTLLEAIIAIAILVIVFTGIIMVSLGGLTGSLRGEERLQATALAQETLEAVRSIRDFDWKNLTAGVHGLSDESGYWAFSGASDTAGNYTRSITVTDVDATTKDVTVHMQWLALAGVTNAIDITNRFTNWLKNSWTQTLQADFNAGTRNSALVTNTAGGEVTLENRADFVNAGVYATHDFPGGGDITDIYIVGNTLYLVTTNDGTGKEFASVDISNVSNGAMTDLNSLELGTQANRVVVSGGYAYIATNSSSEEVMIVRLSDFAKVNSIDVPGSANATGLSLSGATLYVAKKKSSSKEFYAYDVSSPQGPIGSPVGSTELGADVNDIAVSGGYAYVAANDDSKELMVIRLSDYSVVKTVNLAGSAEATTVQIAGTTAYVGRENSSDPEFYSLNVASPEVSIPINGSVDFGSDENVIDLAISGGSVYAGTERESGSQDKKVAIINASTITLTGWVDFQDAENSKSQSIAMQGSYVYVGSTHTTQTLQVVRGNQSGTYSTTGTFTSSAFDTGSAGTAYGALSWTSGGSGTIKFQLKTADTQANLTNAAWVGPDGTSATYYTASGTSIVTAPGASKRWIQYQSTLAGSGPASPILNDISITYAN